MKDDIDTTNQSTDSTVVENSNRIVTVTDRHEQGRQTYVISLKSYIGDIKYFEVTEESKNLILDWYKSDETVPFIIEYDKELYRFTKETLSSIEYNKCNKNQVLDWLSFLVYNTLPSWVEFRAYSIAIKLCVVLTCVTALTEYWVQKFTTDFILSADSATYNMFKNSLMTISFAFIIVYILLMIYNSIGFFLNMSERQCMIRKYEDSDWSKSTLFNVLVAVLVFAGIGSML